MQINWFILFTFVQFNMFTKKNDDIILFVDYSDTLQYMISLNNIVY